MKKKYLFVSMIAVALLSACSNSEDNEALDSAAAPQLTVFGTIDNGNATRVDPNGDGNAWDGNEAIGITLSGNTTEYSNVKYTNSTAGESGSFSTTSTVYVDGKNDVTVNAYYPYAESVTDNTISFNISDTDNENKYEAKDFMFATATVTKSSPAATLLFAHKMNRLCLTLSSSDFTIGNDTEYTATFDGLFTSGTFNTTTGAITNGETTGKVKVTGTGSKIYMIYPPQDKTATMTLKIGGKYYVANVSLSPTTLGDTGKTLNYTVTIKNASVAVSLSDVSITGWSDDDKSDGITANEKSETTSSDASSSTWTGSDSNTIDVTKQ